METGKETLALVLLNFLTLATRQVVFVYENEAVSGAIQFSRAFMLAFASLNGKWKDEEIRVSIFTRIFRVFQWRFMTFFATLLFVLLCARQKLLEYAPVFRGHAMRRSPIYFGYYYYSAPS